jgi:hypothetical protein
VIHARRAAAGGDTLRLGCRCPASLGVLTCVNLGDCLNGFCVVGFALACGPLEIGTPNLRQSL